MSTGSLPRRLDIGGRSYRIDSDFRNVLNILIAYDDPELEDREKAYVCLSRLYPDFEHMPSDAIEDAYKQAVWFIGGGGAEISDEGARPTPRTVDWQQDEPLLFAAINRVAGKEIRAVKYLHWWTFLGYFSEITDGPYAQILSLRLKKARGKPLEKWEKEFWASNRSVCQLRPKLSAEERAERDRINALLG